MTAVTSFLIILSMASGLWQQLLDPERQVVFVAGNPW